MWWGKKKKTLDVQRDSVKKVRGRRRAVRLASTIAMGVGTIILGIVTIWLLTIQAFL